MVYAKRAVPFVIAIVVLLTSAVPAHAASSGGITRATAGGTQQWLDKYKTTNGVSSSAEAVSPDGSTVFVTGRYNKQNGGGLYRGLTLAYDATTGGKLWTAFYNPRGSGTTTEFNSVAASPSGSVVFVTGQTAKGLYTPDRALTVAYNAATGAMIWEDTLTTESGSGPVTVSPDGRRCSSAPSPA